MENLIIVGTSSTAKHVYEFVRMYKLFNIIGFAVNRDYKNEDIYLGLPVYELESLNSCIHVDFRIFVAIFWNRLNKDRRLVYEYCKRQGYVLANIISPNAIIRGILDGDNIWIHDYVVIQNDAVIQSDVLVMAASLISHDTKIAPHCFVAAHAVVAGGVTIGEQTFIGLNATIFDDTIIGKKCIIGACSAIKRNMPDYSKYIIASTNMSFKQYNEEEVEQKLIFSLNKR